MKNFLHIYEQNIQIIHQNVLLWDIGQILLPGNEPKTLRSQLNPRRILLFDMSSVHSYMTLASSLDQLVHNLKYISNITISLSCF